MSEKKEYIERGAFLNWLNKRMDEVGTDKESRFYVNQTMTILESFPAADVEPAVRGRWKGEGMGDYRCSWCDEVVSGKPNYCRNCGAHMTERSGSGEI